jgi:GNAT superfamily N-acetyltransferase
MTGNPMARMLDVVGWTLRSIADEVHDVSNGWWLRSPSMPQVWSLNQFRLTAPTTARDLIELADRFQDGLSYRHVEIDAELSEGLEEHLASAGWRIDREVYMALGATPADVDDADIEELNEDQSSVLMGQWAEEDHPGISPASVAQLVELSRREGRLWGERRFGVVASDKTPVALTKLRANEAIAWVEDVFTTKAARRRGHARRLVNHAAGIAGASSAELTFIVADDNDWPKHLYEEIGFRPVGYTWTFHRELAGGSPTDHRL